MAASIPWWVLSGHRKKLRVLDPMAGSGTTLVVARANGHQAIGFDFDPLAVLIAKAWCSDVDVQKVTSHGEQVVRLAKNLLRMPERLAYPSGGDEPTRAFVRYWFDVSARRQLTALAKAIELVCDNRSRVFLWCAFSKLIITKQAGASLARDVSHSRPHKFFEVSPIKPLKAFPKAVRSVIESAVFQGKNLELPRARVLQGDARNLPLEDESVDAIITSPPYFNAIDYLRGHRLALVWMRYTISELRALRARGIGREAAARTQINEATSSLLKRMGRVDLLPSREYRLLSDYVEDMKEVIQEIRRVTIPGGRVVLVVGDSMIRGVYLRNSVAIKELAEKQDMRLLSSRRRMIPPNRRYLPPPSASAAKGLSKRMRTEVVMTFVV